MNISVVQSMIDAIEKPAIFITPNYTILAVNDAYRQTYEMEVVLGKSRCFEISHGHQAPCEQHGEECPIQLCVNTDKTCNVVHIHKAKGGKTHCDILMKQVKDDDGITVGFLEILDRIEFATVESEANKMVGKSVAFKKLINKINRAAQSDIAVLLSGETGTGKELAAKALHDSSLRSAKPLVVIECTGLNENLFESELFGHEKGAFTGATQTKEGLIEFANGGTVLFDEIADVPLSMQVKLLRLFETQLYRTVGGVQQRQADFRLVCASNKDLIELVEKGEFRKDLYYRIAGFPISLPALTERMEDVPTLALHFLNHSQLNHKKFSDAALEKLCQYDYPGNIRELKSIVEQAALLANEDLIDIEDLPEQLNNQSHAHSQPLSGVVSLVEAERNYLQYVCETQTATIEELSKKLEISTRTLYRKLQKYGLKFD